jgi:hypothetical protein
MITKELTWWPEDMEEETTYEFPAINEVCDGCDGEGFVLIEGMRGRAYSQEEFDEEFFDDEDRLAYFYSWVKI